MTPALFSSQRGLLCCNGLLEHSEMDQSSLMWSGDLNRNFFDLFWSIMASLVAVGNLNPNTSFSFPSVWSLTIFARLCLFPFNFVADTTIVLKVIAFCPMVPTVSIKQNKFHCHNRSLKVKLCCSHVFLPTVGKK